MVDAVTPVAPSPVVVIPPSLNPADLIGANRPDSIGFAPFITQQDLDAAAASLDVTRPAPTDFDFNDGLLNLDNNTLLLFNQFGIDPANPNTGNLTAQQLQALGLLQKDLQGLEDAANANGHTPLTTTTVELSPEAQTLVDSASNPAINANFTSAELDQIRATISPLTGEQLTPALVLQIQTQLAAAGVNPLQLSLSTLFAVMHYMSGAQAPLDNTRMSAEGDEGENDMKVNATSATYAVLAHLRHS